MNDDLISRIEAALAFAPHEAFRMLGVTRLDISTLLDRLKAAEGELETEQMRLRSENERLRKALSDVIADLEYEGSDGWMTGQVHSDEYKVARAALENTDARL